MRQIVLDTETTGLDPKQGHRIIELAGIEVVNRRATGRTVQFHLDPEREIDGAATEVHGRTWDDLKGKPKFRDIAAEFLEFARGAEWIMHNAAFDVAFLDVELELAGHPACAAAYGKLTDTLALARDLFPGKRNSLDALCERFDVDHAHRSLHGALLDALLLAEVWLAMTRGQETLAMELAVVTTRQDGVVAGVVSLGATVRSVPLVVIEPTAEELAAHREYLAALEKETGGRCLWLAAIADSPQEATLDAA
jgi:DNA polymerase-3 subunit epsilon